MRFLALHLSWRHRFAAYADLSSDKERLGSESRSADLLLHKNYTEVVIGHIASVTEREV